MESLETGFESEDREIKAGFDTNGATVIAHILSDREARCITLGLENVLFTRFWLLSSSIFY
jgi:hypothetical protein